MSKVVEALKGLVPVVLVAAVVAGVVFGVLSLFGGGDEDEDGGVGAALALGPAESSWVPGQQSLVGYPQFAALFDRALPLAQRRREARDQAVEDLAQRKIAAQKRAEAAARRRYEEAKRRAQRLYKLALRKAAEERRKQLEKIARARARARRLERERQEKLKVRPGDECSLPGVREKFDCETGKLPDTAKPPEQKREEK